MRLDRGRPPNRSLRCGDDHGAVAVIVAVFTVVILGAAAFVVDYGYAYANRRALSTAADGAALAGARELQIRRTGNQTCAQLLSSANQTAAATSAADIGRQAGLDDASIATTITCDSVGNVIVEATATTESPAFFGDIYGEDDYSLTRSARAIVAPVSYVTGLRPLSICVTDADSMMAQVTSAGAGGAISVTLDKTSDTVCTTSGSGNWSRVDFDGSGDLVNWIANGYSGPISLATDGTTQLQAITGNNWPSGMTEALTGLLDRVITVPVYTLATGTGSNVEYTVIGFLAAKLCGWQKTPTHVSGNHSYGTCYDSSIGMPSKQDALQIRFDRLIPPGGASFDCGVGTSGCTYSPLLVKLIG